MKRRILCVVPCGKTKIWEKNPTAGPTPTKDVYVGGFSGLCKAYALKFYSDYWCTVSAKYGFLFPEDIVPGPYDVTFLDKSTNPISIEELDKQAREFRSEIDKVVVVAGSTYAKVVERVFPEAEVVKPLKGLGAMGYMKKALKKAIEDNTPIE